MNHATFIDSLENILRYARDVKDEPQFVTVVQVSPRPRPPARVKLSPEHFFSTSISWMLFLNEPFYTYIALIPTR